MRTMDGLRVDEVGNRLVLRFRTSKCPAPSLAWSRTELGKKTSLRSGTHTAASNTNSRSRSSMSSNVRLGPRIERNPSS